MHLAKIAIAVCALSLVTGCPNKDRHASIEAMNQGIESANAGNSGSAVTAFKEAVRVYPENHQAWYNLGQIYGRDKKWEEAAEAFGEAVKYRGNDAMYHMQRGIALYEVDNKSLSQTHLEKAIELNPDLYRAHYYLGRVLRDLGRPKDAAEAWTRAATLNPLFGPPFTRLGELYLRWDHTQAAISVLQQATNYVKDDTELTNVFYYLGLAYDAEKNWDKAIEAYTSAIEMRSDNVDARFQRGLAYGKKGENVKARKDLEEYGKQGGDNAFNKEQANRILLQLMSADL